MWLEVHGGSDWATPIRAFKERSNLLFIWAKVASFFAFLASFSEIGVVDGGFAEDGDVVDLANVRTYNEVSPVNHILTESFAQMIR